MIKHFAAAQVPQPRSICEQPETMKKRFVIIFIAFLFDCDKTVAA
jgi:hypothetical protein